jgi:hypothetical protein
MADASAASWSSTWDMAHSDPTIVTKIAVAEARVFPTSPNSRAALDPSLEATKSAAATQSRLQAEKARLSAFHQATKQRTVQKTVTQTEVTSARESEFQRALLSAQKNAANFARLVQMNTR